MIFAARWAHVVNYNHMKNITIGILIIILVGIGGFVAWQQGWFAGTTTPQQNTDTATTTDMSDQQSDDTTTQDDTQTTIGQSVDGRDIVAYHYGSGDTEVLFVSGIHGGYEWNTTLVAYELMDYLEAQSSVVPDNVRVTVVPVLNPDGLHTTVGTAGRFTRADVPTPQSATVAGRFNANTVDLNRNFACDWQEEGIWQSRTVNAGTSAFSEPESQAIRDYVNEVRPAAVVVYYSAAGGVFASSCHNGVLDETLTLTNLYADASGYPAYEEFDFYEITGDMVNWLASEDIPAISVLLTNHTDVEWSQNRAGVDAILNYYAE